MPILFDLNGMPTQVPDARINDFIRQGYRTQLPRIAEVVEMASHKKAQRKPESAPPSVPGALAINTAALKELSVALPGINTGDLRKLMSDRPYSSVEDLIAKFPQIDWLNLAINFDAD